MRKDRDTKLDSTQATLTVTYGNTRRKVRPLDRDVIIIGAGSACDVNLVSPEVANIHCVVVRVADGWRVRDCGSRSGTHLNGKIVQESPVADGDVLQIGSFSFHFNLPTRSAPGNALRSGSVNGADSSQLQKLQRSRRHLAELALALRRRCRSYQEQARAIHQAENLVEERHFDLAKQREALRKHQQQLERTACELTQREQQLRERFTALERELADFRDQHDQAGANTIRYQAEENSQMRLIQEREASVSQSETTFAAAAAEVETLRAKLEQAQADLTRQHDRPVARS